MFSMEQLHIVYATYFGLLLCFSLYVVLILLVRGKHGQILLQMIENFSKAFNKLLNFSNHSFSHNLESKKE